ncbi:MAG: putative Tfp pilus assembly protein PilW [Burkholderia sp.]|nr:putative Tfp pilus assembly protein PilW [Burkholderia sp.]
MSEDTVTRHTRGSNASPAIRQAGLSLVELMISIALGLFVVVAATALLLSTKAGYVTQDDNARIQETGRHAIEMITRAVRQAAYENWDSEEAPIVTTTAMSANIDGLDASRPTYKSIGMRSLSTDGVVNGSDILAVGFFGAGQDKKGDGTMLNCGGFSVPAATSQSDAEAARAWNIFYVGVAESGVPQLYCKYGRDKTWSTETIASEVESFQVLYGLDTTNDGIPDNFVNATEVNKSPGNWKKVAVIKISLLLRGGEKSRSDALTTQYDLFGKDYADRYAASDSGTSIKESDLNADKNRARKLFTTTIHLRNQPVRAPA